MPPRLEEVSAHLLEGLAQNGIRPLDVEADGDILILTIDPAKRSLLLSDPILRTWVVEQAKQHGFLRVAVEL